MNFVPIRVLCIDDNRLLAESLARRLAFEPDIAWAGWAEHSRDALSATLASRPDVVLLDIDMPEHDAFAVLRALGDAIQDVRVIMFSGHVRDELIDQAIGAGAWGYLSKNDSMENLINAIRRVAGGDVVMSPGTTAGFSAGSRTTRSPRSGRSRP